MQQKSPPNNTAALCFQTQLLPRKRGRYGLCGVEAPLIRGSLYGGRAGTLPPYSEFTFTRAGYGVRQAPSSTSRLLDGRRT
ncbi:hypothetical protein NDU88_001235 [Pleurodeles waltl]|uniref:Uncharacterized protein n=1 Tax=Pleurodeles waltl TaxID=8319 RepID=A0AAV7KNY2_PLEWA|nr:hypothetical protein NDU88_001235 [Pleurodeles waltl]